MRFYRLSVLRNLYSSSSPSMPMMVITATVGARLTDVLVLQTWELRSVYGERSAGSYITCVSFYIIVVIIASVCQITRNVASTIKLNWWIVLNNRKNTYFQFGVRFPTVRLRHGPQRREETAAGQPQRWRFPVRKRT